MKTTTVTLWLRVENKSKFVRGKKRARENIENYHLRRCGMKKFNDWEYELTSPTRMMPTSTIRSTIYFKKSKWKLTCGTVLPKPM